MKWPALEEPDIVENSAAPLTRPTKLTGWRCRWLQAGLAIVAMLWLARQESLVRGFVAYDCANATNSVNSRGGKDHLWRDCPNEQGLDNACS
jgi:hypothetical protein